MMHIMKQVSFQNWCHNGVRDDETDTTLVLFCVEDLFHVSGFVNSQNKSYAPAENLMLTHKESLHYVKANARYANSTHSINGPVIFSETTN